MKKLCAALAAMITLFVATDALALRDCPVRNYATAASRDASTPKDCTIAYALDDDTFKLRTAGAWVALTLSGTTLLDDAQIVLGTGSDAVISFDKSVQAPDSLIIAVGVESRQLVIMEKHVTDLAADLTLAQQTNPTLVIRSADSTDANDYILIAMDQTNGVIDVGQGSLSIPDPVVITGDLTINGAGGSITLLDGDETILIKDNDVNSFMIVSSGAPALATFDTTTDNERLILSGTTMSDAFHVTVGTAQFDESVDITGTLAVTGAVTVSTDLTVTAGANIAELAAPMGYIVFCGNGANGSTAWYMAPTPVNFADDMTTYDMGEAGCDAADGNTEVTEDEVLFLGLAFKPTSMVCSIEDTTSGDTATFQLREDVSDVATMTCTTTTLDSSGYNQCVVRSESPEIIAAGSTLAMKTIMSGTDDLSAAAVYCIVYYTF